MPIDRDVQRTLEDARHMAQNFAATFPGHCGRCGLPFKLCFHRSEEYGRAPRHNPSEMMHSLRRLYIGALNQMTLEEIHKLPRPPRDWMTMEVINHIKLHEAGMHRDAFPEWRRVSIWVRIMGEDEWE
jgi:hypothetical protein